MHHSHMQSLADALANESIESLRYHFPYMEAGGGRTDNLANCLMGFTTFNAGQPPPEGWTPAFTTGSCANLDWTCPTP